MSKSLRVEEDSSQKELDGSIPDSLHGKPVSKLKTFFNFVIGITFLILLVGFLPFLFYLEDKSHIYKDMQDEEVKNVVRVFMNDPNEYTFFINQPESHELIVKNFSVRDVRNQGDSTLIASREVKVFADVPSEKKMWVLVKKVNHIYTRMLSSQIVWQYPIVYSLELHIHSEKEVEGGGWNHGKSGSGITQVVR